MVKDSEFEEPSFPDDVRKNLLGQFGKEIMKIAVDQLRGEFQQIAVEGGRQGAQMMLHGKDMTELQQELTQKEQQLLKLKMEKKKLEEDLCSEKVKKDEVQLLVAEKEMQIRFLESEAQNIRRLMRSLKKEASEEKASATEREAKLASELKDLRGKYNNVKSKLQVKESASNIAKTKLTDCREELDRLKRKP